MGAVFITSLVTWELTSTDFEQFRNGLLRRAIVFHLVPVLTALPEPIEENNARPLDQLRKDALDAGSEAPDRKTSKALSTYFVRSIAIRDYALARAKGKCECCSQNAPFKTSANNPFLEIHHIRRLSDGGPDKPSAVAAVCPNCHREAHHGEYSKSLNAKLLQKISLLELELEI
jgi:5-methylcytosine-specific restriction protein A